jgi:hypothetical protein
MEIARVGIKRKADLEAALGRDLARTVMGFRDSSDMRRLPSGISFHDVKPAFHLNDGDTLTAYGVELSGKVRGSHYCGSAESVLNHLSDQFSEGAQAPENHAIIFMRTYWNGRNTSWDLTVVSPNITKEIGGGRYEDLVIAAASSSL